MDFPVCNTADNQPYSIDFIQDVQNGETVTSAVVTLTLFSGTDPNPNGHIQGSYALNNSTIVTVPIAGLLPNNVYSLNITATTSLNYQVELYALIPCSPVYS
jgi:hypothetical protein